MENTSLLCQKYIQLYLYFKVILWIKLKVTWLLTENNGSELWYNKREYFSGIKTKAALPQKI